MKISRRKFLAASPLVAGALLLNRNVVGQGPQMISSSELEIDELARLSWDSFYPFINTEFSFGVGYNSVSLKLIGMTDSRPPRLRSKSGLENFVMRFQGPRDRVLAQGTYRVNHFNLGDFDLFITNGAKVRREQYYIAVINRSVI